MVGVLSPLLWNVEVKELPKQIENQGYRVVDLADDPIITLSGPILGILVANTQRILKKMRKLAYRSTRRRLRSKFSRDATTGTEAVASPSPCVDLCVP